MLAYKILTLNPVLLSQYLWRSVSETLLALTDNPRQLQKQIERVKSLRPQLSQQRLGQDQQRLGQDQQKLAAECQCGHGRCAGGFNNNHENAQLIHQVK